MEGLSSFEEHEIGAEIHLPCDSVTILMEFRKGGVADEIHHRDMKFMPLEIHARVPRHLFCRAEF